MSTSILYHAFGLKGIEYHATRYLGSYVIFSAEMNGRKYTCPNCRGDQIIYKGSEKRWFRMPPIGRKLFILDLLLHRVQCCGKQDEKQEKERPKIGYLKPLTDEVSHF